MGELSRASYPTAIRPALLLRKNAPIDLASTPAVSYVSCSPTIPRMSYSLNIFLSIRRSLILTEFIRGVQSRLTASLDRQGRFLEHTISIKKWFGSRFLLYFAVWTVG